MKTQVKNILSYFPQEIEKVLVVDVTDNFEKLEEIRFRVLRPIILKLRDDEKIIKYSVSTEEILNILAHICENSIYSYQNEISCVIENSKVININYVYSLNFRIAKEIIGCSQNIFKEIVNLESNSVYNTLIVSPPGSRKNYNIKGFNKIIIFRSKRI